MLKIRYPRGLLDKLGVKPESKVVALRLEDQNFLDQLTSRAHAFSKSTSTKGADLVFFRADGKERLTQLKALQAIIARNGAVWVIAPKGKQHIKESAVVSYSQTLSSMTSDVQRHRPLPVPLERGVSVQLRAYPARKGK